MNYSEIIAKELKVETKHTKRILAALNDECLGWKPHEKSMTVGELASHVVELHNWVALALKKERFDFQTDYHPHIATTVNELIELLDNNLETNLATIQSFSDEDWEQKWILCSGDYVIHESNKQIASRFIIQNHIIHHRGQLSVYLRLLDLPVPGIYGPSADEKQ